MFDNKGVLTFPSLFLEGGGLLCSAWTFQYCPNLYFAHCCLETSTRHTYVVVGVEHAGNVLRQIPIQNGLDVIADVDCRHRRTVFFKL